MPNSSIRLFIDFDGTVTTIDTGDAFFRHFGEFEPIHSQLLNGEFSVGEYYIRSVALLSNKTTPQAIREFALAQPVDACMRELLDVCRRYNVDVTVVSDGFDAYITPILEHAGLDYLNVRCNRLIFDSVTHTWTPTFPGASDSCSCFCASCKRNVLLASSAPNDVIVYVGDGRSDRCAAEHADVVFAKDNLRSWCSNNGIPHHPFHSLRDVCRILERRLRTNDLRARKQAELARKRAFEAE